MFEKKTVDAYKTIQPSPHLRERVVQLQADTAIEETKILRFRGFYRSVGVVAACCVLVLAFFLLNLHTSEQVVLYAGNQAVTIEHGVPAPQQDAQLRAYSLASQEDTLTVSLKLTTTSESNISVDNGVLSCYDAQSGEPLDMQQIPKGETQLYWTISMLDAQGQFHLYIVTKKEPLSYLLYFDTSANQWMICQENEKE